MEILAIIVSVVAIFLALFTIWQANNFYKMSKEDNTKIKESSDNIANNLIKLEALFNDLNSNTFKLVRDIVENLQRQAWPEVRNISTIKTGAEISSLVKEVPKEEMAKIIKEQKISDADTDKKWDELQIKISNIIEKLLKSAEKIKLIEAKKAIISMVDEKGIVAQHLYSRFIHLKRFLPSDFFTAVNSLKEEGILDWKGNTFEPDSVIRIKKKTWKYL